MIYSDQREGQWPRQSNSQRPYSPSLSSSVCSSSVESVFSVDNHSSQSSAPSSSKSVGIAWDSDTRACENLPPSSDAQASGDSSLVSTQPPLLPQSRTSDVPVAPEKRVHPRRTNACTTIGNDKASCPGPKPPPSLTRQCDRKDHFVESLVDTTTQMIEVIWPLSVVPCGRDTVLGGKNLIGLRTFIQEVLKRSKTSYSTLQVALYYLVLVKPCIPKVDFTQIQLEDTHAFRAMQCGRRMFLSALILASKYLQDRNYSARAWSKISGLKIPEINSNEIAFLNAINWRLHVPEARFQRWTDVVLRYSPSPPSTPVPRSDTRSFPTWRNIVPLLTPELDDFDESTCILSVPENVGSQTSPSVSSFEFRRVKPETMPLSDTSITTLSKPPKTLEPNLLASREKFSFPPISPQIIQLPTPRLTPTQNGISTPAASCKASYHRGSAMSNAMKQINSLSMLRSTLDPWYNLPTSAERITRGSSESFRAVSLAGHTQSMASSPESMVSDTSSISSLSSRASSVSSKSSGSSLLHGNRSCPPVQGSCTTGLTLNVNHGIDSKVKTPTNERWVHGVNIPVMPTESYVRVARYDAEIGQGTLTVPDDHDDALRSMSAPNQLNTGHKRTRPNYEPAYVLPSELRTMLKQSHCYADYNKSVVEHPDLDGSSSATLRSGYRLSHCIQISGETRATLSEQSMARKRHCPDLTDRARFEYASSMHEGLCV